jgi:hypothetical protein
LTGRTVSTKVVINVFSNAIDYQLKCGYGIKRKRAEI